MPDAGGNEPVHKQYSGERDMEAFWRAAKLPSEPAKQRWYIPTLLIFVVLSVPWYFASGHTGRVLGGLPVWVWITLGCSLVVACLTGVAALRFWVDGSADDD